jgi:hypothetical protein
MKVTEWRTYKVYIRETKKQIGYPENVTYPCKPEA